MREKPHPQSYGLMGSLIGGVAGFGLGLAFGGWWLPTVALTCGLAAFFGQIFPAANAPKGFPAPWDS